MTLGCVYFTVTANYHWKLPDIQGSAHHCLCDHHLCSCSQPQTVGPQFRNSPPWCSPSHFPDSHAQNSLVSISDILIHEKCSEISNIVYSDSGQACLAPSLLLPVKMASEVSQSPSETGTDVGAELWAAFCPKTTVHFHLSFDCLWSGLKAGCIPFRSRSHKRKCRRQEDMAYGQKEIYLLSHGLYLPL